MCGLKDLQPFRDGDALKLAEHYSNKGADALLIFDLSSDDADHERSLGLIKQMSRLVDIPMYGFGNINRVEDVKKLIYAGCRKAVLNYNKPSNMEMLEEVSKRFGKDKVGVCIDVRSDEVMTDEIRQKLNEYTEENVVMTDVFMCLKNKADLALLGDIPVLLVVFGSETLSMEDKMDFSAAGMSPDWQRYVTREIPETDIMGNEGFL